MQLRYGTNPDQPARASLDDPDGPVRVVAGQPSYINVLDALSAWQLVRQAAIALGTPVATSFKHVSPAGAATAGATDDVMTGLWRVSPSELSPVASAYIRARDCDPQSSFGDFVAVSAPVDWLLADLLAGVVSDGIIAPGFEPGTTRRLAAKKGGRYLVLEADPSYQPPEWEQREVFGVRLEQRRPPDVLTPELIAGRHPTPIPPQALADLTLALITARFTQSNSVTFAKDGMVLGVGAGQQSRIACTKLAGAKVDTWWLRRHPSVRDLDFRPDVRRQDRINWQLRLARGELDATGLAALNASLSVPTADLSTAQRDAWLAHLRHVVMASDGYIPFRDNIDEAARHGVAYVAHPGGSLRTSEVSQACAEHGIGLVDTGLRLFHH